MTKVSVIVPVYNPGERIEPLLRSLLAQSMPAGECELIFVDDGSTDGTPARLDALAAEHGHVVVRHIPNSGWPGRPRNVGLDLASGEHVYFADNDDWLGEEALERLHATAAADDADIVIGRVVGHGKQVPRGFFARDRHGVAFDGPDLLRLLTPHKLFRRALLEEHGIRFPEGPRRLEDHLFVVHAYFHARRISVLAGYPCYHWVHHGGEANASVGDWEPAGYYADVREVLDLVEDHTEPGPLRDALMAHWYRGKMLGRVGGSGWLRTERDRRRRLHDEVRRLAVERYGPDAAAGLPFNLRVRSRLLHHGRFEDLEALARFEDRLRARARVTGPLGVRARLRGLDLVRRDGRIRWLPPEELRPALGAEGLDMTEEAGRGRVQLVVRSPADRAEHPLRGRSEAEVSPRAPWGRTSDGPVRVTLRARVTGDVPPGDWDVIARVRVGGFSAATRPRWRDRSALALSARDGRLRARHRWLPPAVRRRLRRG